MKCPTCQQEMEKKREEVTNNVKEGREYKEYKKVVYWCEKDDTWVSIETPLKLNQNLA